MLSDFKIDFSHFLLASPLSGIQRHQVLSVLKPFGDCLFKGVDFHFFLIAVLHCAKYIHTHPSALHITEFCSCCLLSFCLSSWFYAFLEIPLLGF